MTFQAWEAQVPHEIRQDPVWKVKAYRLALFLSDLAWPDATKLLKDRRTSGVADQLFRAAGNISSNICEGFSRGTGKDRACFYEYALGSGRGLRDWYYKSRRALQPDVSEHRMKLASEVIALLVSMLKTEHKRPRLQVRRTDE